MGNKIYLYPISLDILMCVCVEMGTYIRYSVSEDVATNHPTKLVVLTVNNQYLTPALYT